MRKTRLLAIAVLTSAGLLTTVSAGTAAGSGTEGSAGATTATRSAAASCGVTWGSLPKAATDSGNRPLTNVRTGRHECYDRMVLDIRGDLPADPVGYHVRYVSKLYQDGSGHPIAIGGGAILEIVASAPSYDPESYEPTYAGRGGKPLPGVNLTGYRTFRDTRFGASYEGTTQLGLGVRARLPFRVFSLGDRLVIDVAHSWAAAR
ncbi:MAG: AMIN-like domain-containing (lipo)protein [Streptomyces sp.]|uniref:AMIN-like domain-containing (lipo)protein n=1 Tax=Streptomyces sp. TaxID=1931 RepID=UPI003D6BD79D